MTPNALEIHRSAITNLGAYIGSQASLKEVFAELPTFFEKYHLGKWVDEDNPLSPPDIMQLFNREFTGQAAVRLTDITDEWVEVEHEEGVNVGNLHEFLRAPVAASRSALKDILTNVALGKLPIFVTYKGENTFKQAHALRSSVSTRLSKVIREKVKVSFLRNDDDSIIVVAVTPKDWGRKRVEDEAHKCFESSVIIG